MHVLDWPQKRKRLLRQLAGADTGVARRIVQVETAWEEASQEMAQPNEPDLPLQEFTTAEDFLLQPKPPLTEVSTAQVPQEIASSQLGNDVIAAAKNKALASYLD